MELLENPDEFEIQGKKLKINTDFKTWILVKLCVSDKLIDDDERYYIICKKVFNIYDRFLEENKNIVLDNVYAFLTCFPVKEYDNSYYCGDNKIDITKEEHLRYIRMAILQTYPNVDILKNEIHWWDFVFYVNTIGDNSALSVLLKKQNCNYEDLNG